MHHSNQLNNCSCLTPPRHKNKIGYWVSNIWYLYKKVKIKYMYIKNSQSYKHNARVVLDIQQKHIKFDF